MAAAAAPLGVEHLSGTHLGVGDAQEPQEGRLCNRRPGQDSAARQRLGAQAPAGHLARANQVEAASSVRAGLHVDEEAAMPVELHQEGPDVVVPASQEAQHHAVPKQRAQHQAPFAHDLPKLQRPSVWTMPIPKMRNHCLRLRLRCPMTKMLQNMGSIRKMMMTSVRMSERGQLGWAQKEAGPRPAPLAAAAVADAVVAAGVEAAAVAAPARSDS